MSHLGFSAECIATIKTLYTHPLDFPRIGGFTHCSCTLDRGVRQGCPLSPLLLVIYMNVVLYRLEHLLNQHTSPASDAWAFIDDILVRVQTPAQAQQVFEFFAGPVRQLGLEMNVSKAKTHARDPSAPFSITLNSGQTLSTFDKHGQPHTSYKYLGIWILTNTAALQLYTFLQNEIVRKSAFPML